MGVTLGGRNLLDALTAAASLVHFSLAVASALALHFSSVRVTSKTASSSALVFLQLAAHLLLATVGMVLMMGGGLRGVLLFCGGLASFDGGCCR